MLCLPSFADSKQRSLNRSGGPVNTFFRKPASDPRSTSTVTLAGSSTKRQKIEFPSNAGYSTSRFFTRKHPRAKLYDLSQDGSPEDPYDLKSVSSTTSYQKPSVHPTVAEFRTAQPRNRTPSKRSRRRRRPVPSKVRAKGSANGSGDDSIGPDSPDILAIDNGSPPPANVISDIVSQQGAAKRARELSFSGPQVKRPKPAHNPSDSIEVSEDELQATSKSSRDSVTERRTNFFQVPNRNITRVRSRGDIPSTKFRSSGNSNAPDTREELGFRLKKAVSGFNLWCPKSAQKGTLIPQLRDDGSTKWAFHLSIQQASDGTAMEDPSEIEKSDVHESIPWLQITSDKLQTVQHYATRSPYVHIKRHISPGAPAALDLMFDSKEEAVRFLSSIDSSLLSYIEP